MHTQQRKALERYQQALAFLDTAPSVLAHAPIGYTKQLWALRSALTSIEAMAPDRGSGTANQAMAQHRARREALRVEHLRPLRTIARIMARKVVGMPHLIPVPKALESTQKLLDAGKAVARDVERYQTVFVDKGMPPEFLTDLQRQVQAVERGHAAVLAAKQRRTHARGQLQQALRDARDAVICLDLIVRRACAADRVAGNGVLETWNTIVPPRVRAGRVAGVEPGGTDGAA